jgi:hypothetical protein
MQFAFFSLFSLLFSLLVGWLPTAASATAFSDIPDSHPLAPAIIEGLKGSYVRLNSDRVFEPELAISRAEFAYMIARATLDTAEIRDCTEKTTEYAGASWKLTDADYADYYGNALCALQKKNIFGGFGDDTFLPEEGVTFAEAARSLTLAFNLSRVAVPVLQPDDWKMLLPYITPLSAAKIIPVSVRGPQYPVLRGEVLTMIHRLKNRSKTARLRVTEYQLGSHLTDTEQWKNWEKFGMALALRGSWQTPHIVDRGGIDTWFPRSPSLKHITIGREYACKGFGACIDRDFALDLYAPEAAKKMMEEFRTTPTLKTLETWSAGGVSYRRYRERGDNCESEGMLAIGTRYVYRLFYACADKKSAVYTDWMRILRLWTVFPKSDERSRR